MNQYAGISKHDDLAGERSTASQGRPHQQTPFWFTSIARERGEALRIGDYVQVSGLDKKYELLDIFPRFGSVRVRAIGEIECLGLPWRFIEPWKEAVFRSKTVTQAVGDWLFRGNRVYRLDEPDRTLKTVKINWDAETSDVEDEDGQVSYDVPWDSLEFWDPVDYHLPDE